MARRERVAAFLIIASLLVGTRSHAAQGYSIDARVIGMGSAGDRSNLAWEMVPKTRAYHAVPVPLGLAQSLGNFSVFDPRSNEFNPGLAISYASNPLHYTVNRGGSEVGQRFLSDLAHGNLDADLASYRGFTPQHRISARGLTSPEAGKTLWLFDDGSTFHGVYVGAGPYLTLGMDMDFDRNLIDLFAAPAGTVVPNSTYAIRNIADLQSALSFTGGYRMKLPLPGGSATRDGLYIAANYSHLYGLYYDEVDLGAQLDTDPAGWVTGTSPLIADRIHSSSGRGRTVDLAFAVVMEGWDFTAAIEGLGNHIDWRDLRAERHTLASITTGSGFVEAPLPAPVGTLRRELPVRYSAGASFDAGRWAAGGDVARGLDGAEFRGGVEVRFGLVDLRGGGRLVRDAWRPTTGVGLNLTRMVGLDLAMFSTTNNIERIPETSVALSIRIRRGE